MRVLVSEGGREAGREAVVKAFVKQVVSTFKPGVKDRDGESGESTGKNDVTSVRRGESEIEGLIRS